MDKKEEKQLDKDIKRVLSRRVEIKTEDGDLLTIPFRDIIFEGEGKSVNGKVFKWRFVEEKTK